MQRDNPGSTKKGLKFSRVFTDGSPYQKIQWQSRDIRVKDWQTGEIIFSQDKFRVPSFWSENAGQIVASKYAFGPKDAREQGVSEVVGRVVRSIADFGEENGYFSYDESIIFRDELSHLMLHQYAAFNSPVWFNAGIYKSWGLSGSGRVYHWDKDKVAETHESYRYPQTSACFIQSVDDTMESLMALAVAEAMLFKHGSGTGTDFSMVRSKREFLSTGGTPSGPVSFMRMYDRIASIVKSGGKTRRAAKMQTLGCWHPDIMEFIRAKGNEERKAHLLIKGGMDNSFNGEAYDTVAFQNANFTVRYTNEFMQSLKDIELQPWKLIAVTNGSVIEKIDSNVIWNAMAEETHRCGDPGAQFADTINHWHTCPRDKTDLYDTPICSSNPCSEYLFIDDSACNLASLRLTKFWRDGKFQIDEFKHAVRIMVIAQEILVDMGSYPTAKIAQNQHDFRTIGLGFADLGGLLMKMGLAYDSEEGRAVAGCISAIMTGTGYCVSAEMAKYFGEFEGFNANSVAMLAVIEKHRSAIKELGYGIRDRGIHDRVRYLGTEAESCWDLAFSMGVKWGYRNAQISVVAPTGTIAFMMDCDTTGIEPPIGLVAYKTLAGGGNMVIVNDAVSEGLWRLGYSHLAISTIQTYLTEHGHLDGCAFLEPEHLAVFDCALAPNGCDRIISYCGHLAMMAAVQPFISGAISKTVNMPKESTVKDIADAYYLAWEMGLKCVAIYRDESKSSQPVTLNKPSELETLSILTSDDGPRCINCSSTVLVTAGTCAVCPNCGTPQGGCS
jgi:ribonucleoside-diphosphate reductase alpha chain